MNNVGIIAIGRNEGERLRLSLTSALSCGSPVVYVDSHSTDGSADLARSMGAQVVELDMSLPFSAARARNAGVERLATDVRFLLFVDGDCEIAAGWIDRAKSELESRPDVAVVCGRRRERFPDKSVYNRMIDLEWDTPIGEAQSCGGDAMMRADAFAAVGGFDPSVVAGEEPQLCQRLRDEGWKILRVDAEMTIHDSAMLHFSQWWRRAVRGGYGAADVVTRFGRQPCASVNQSDLEQRRGRQATSETRPHASMAANVRSARIWTVGWVLAIAISFLVFLPTAGWKWGMIAAFVMVLTWPAQVFRIALGARKRTATFSDAIAYGFLTMVSKWANLVGEMQYRRDRRAGRHARLIEYKQRTASVAPLAGP